MTIEGVLASIWKYEAHIQLDSRTFEVIKRADMVTTAGHDKEEKVYYEWQLWIEEGRANWAGIISWGTALPTPKFNFSCQLGTDATRIDNYLMHYVQNKLKRQQKALFLAWLRIA